VSRIVIAAQTDKTSAAAVDLQKVLPNRSVDEIRQALSTGAPLVDRVLFYNDHHEAGEQLSAVISNLQKHGIEPRVYELDDDDEVAPLIDSDKQESVEYLHNILERHAQIKADREGRE
jgi:hypothetical protein